VSWKCRACGRDPVIQNQLFKGKQKLYLIRLPPKMTDEEIEQRQKQRELPSQ